MDGKDMANMSNEGLAVEIKNLSVQIADLKAAIATQAADYIRKEIFELKIKDLDSKIAATNLKIVEVEKSSRKANWKSHTLTAIFTAKYAVGAGTGSFGNRNLTVIPL